MEKICDRVHITLNKNAVQGDRSAVSPGGVRVGTPALTTRGMKEAEFRKIAVFMDRAAKIALKIQKTSGKMLKEFVAAIEVRSVFLHLPMFNLLQVTETNRKREKG